MQLEAHSQSERTAAGRSRLYQLLAAAFAFPDEKFFTVLCDGTFKTAITDACRGLPYRLDTASTELRPARVTYEEFQCEYIRLFDVGAAGPPCPLYGGMYVGDRMKVMEDATRFYNFFQLRLVSPLRELPDHVTTELEFMHYLTFQEVEALRSNLDVASLWRAERDFLSRHLCRWVPRLRERLARQRAVAFFPALVGVAAEYFAADHAFAAAACKR
jgi:DMSO reductase family type II enzyme chaperone